MTLAAVPAHPIHARGRHCPACDEKHPPRSAVQLAPPVWSGAMVCGICGVSISTHFAEFGPGGVCPSWPSLRDPIYFAIIESDYRSSRPPPLGKVKRGHLASVEGGRSAVAED